MGEHLPAKTGRCSTLVSSKFMLDGRILIGDPGSRAQTAGVGASKMPFEAIFEKPPKRYTDILGVSQLRFPQNRNHIILPQDA